MIVSVPLGCYNKNTRDNKHLFLTVLDTGKSKIKAQVIWCLVRVCLSTSCCVLVMEWGRELSGLSFIKEALLPFMRVLPLWPNHLPQVPPPNVISLEVRISTDEFWASAFIWSITMMEYQKETQKLIRNLLKSQCIGKNCLAIV